jgi:preprotein translocase subunit Sss1
MAIRNLETSPTINERAASARVAGLGLLIMAILAFFANFFVFEKLIIPGDTVTTVNNIIANESLFRWGIIGFLIAIILDVLVAWALYIFLKPVNKNLALLAAWFRLVYAAIFGVALYNLLNVLQLLSGADYLKVFATDQLHAQVMLSIDAFRITWLVGLVLFGCHLLVLGYLVFKSGYMPRIIGILLIIAGFGYLIDSFAHFLLPNYSDYKTIFLMIVAIPGMIAEISLLFWLLFKGLKVQQIKS